MENVEEFQEISPFLRQMCLALSTKSEGINPKQGPRAHLLENEVCVACCSVWLSGTGVSFNMF